MFNDPLKYKILPMKNFFTRDNKVQYTGFFIPAHKFSLIPQYVDHRGYTDSEEFKKHYESERALLEGMDLVDYCAEYCFYPDEALLRQGDNIFDTAAISDRSGRLVHAGRTDRHRIRVCGLPWAFHVDAYAIFIQPRHQPAGLLLLRCHRHRLRLRPGPPCRQPRPDCRPALRVNANQRGFPLQVQHLYCRRTGGYCRWRRGTHI